MQDLSYGFGITLAAGDFAAAVERVTAALQEQGFGVLTEIDVQATLRKKLDRDFRRYKILGACNPQLAHQALEREPHIGLLLPCNVVVQETGAGDIEVSIADPQSMMRAADNPELADIAEEARTRLQRALQALA